MGTGLFQYFVKLVPTVHWVGPHIDGRASEKSPSSSSSPESEKPATLTSQFSYTYKFRSLEGDTEYHMEQVDGDHPLHHAAHDQEKDDSKSSGRPNTLVLPGTEYIDGLTAILSRYHQSFSIGKILHYSFAKSCASYSAGPVMTPNLALY